MTLKLDPRAVKIIEDALVAVRFGQNALSDETHLAKEAAARLAALSSAPATAEGWRTMDSAPTGDELFLAACPPDDAFPNGRIMIWRGYILAMQNDKTPDHLRFPATGWMPLPTAKIPDWPAAPTATGGR